jgi:hypothetical protein
MTTTVVVVIVIVVSSFWVAFDASAIGAGKGLDSQSTLDDTSPAAWFLFCLLLWIIGFPLYLSRRPLIKASAAASKKAELFTDREWDEQIGGARTMSERVKLEKMRARASE